MNEDKLSLYRAFMAAQLAQSSKQEPDDRAGMQNAPYPYGEGYQNMNLSSYQYPPPPPGPGDSTYADMIRANEAAHAASVREADAMYRRRAIIVGLAVAILAAVFVAMWWLP